MAAATSTSMPTISEEEDVVPAKGASSAFTPTRKVPACFNAEDDTDCSLAGGV